MIPREFTPAYLQRAAEREERGLDPDYEDPIWDERDLGDEESLHRDEGDDE